VACDTAKGDRVVDSAAITETEEAQTYYDRRYQRGYMTSHPDFKVRRIAEVLGAMDLPRRGVALDYGCGNGVLTDVLRKSLPEWDIFGTDLSPTAVASAAASYPECSFFPLDAPAIRPNSVDLVFTHHVLEHVLSVPDILADMDTYLKPEAAMLHVLPCGNPGSFEHTVCRLTREGINGSHGGRFFFEDEGHLRRLTSDQLSAMCATLGYRTTGAYFINQFAGAVDWISASSPSFVREFADPGRAVDSSAACRLTLLRLMLFMPAAVSMIVRVWERELHAPGMTPTRRVRLAVAAPLYLLTVLPHRGLRWALGRARDREWDRRKTDPCGSAMYVCLARKAPATLRNLPPGY
jgi:trans-aconitate methyltransferase